MLVLEAVHRMDHQLACVHKVNKGFRLLASSPKVVLEVVLVC